MLNINTKKQSYTHATIQDALNAIAIFGTTCQLCGNTEISFIEFEHLYTESENKSAMYPCCSSHNKDKSNKLPQVWFASKGRSDLFATLENAVLLLANVSQTERDLVFVSYIQQILNWAKNDWNVLPDGIIRLMVQPIPRQLLNGISFENVHVSKLQADTNRLGKFYDLSSAKFE